MPIYVYRCPEDHRVEMTHGIKEEPVVQCEKCGKPMRRVPQPFRFSLSAQGILLDWMDENYRRWRTKRPRFSPDAANRPGKPLPATKPR